MYLQNRLRAALCASLSLPTLILIGCSDAGTVTQNPAQPALVTGNWQVSSSASAAARLPSFSGEFTTQVGKTTAIVHSQAASACIAPATSFDLAGSADEKGNITLTGSVRQGHPHPHRRHRRRRQVPHQRHLQRHRRRLRLHPKRPGQRPELRAPSPATIPATSPTWTARSPRSPPTSHNPQPPTPNGNFTLAGTATLPNNPCFPTTVPISNTQVTGGTFTFTYAYNGSSVTANGIFSPSATTLTVTSWLSSGACGADTGVQSTMTQAGS